MALCRPLLSVSVVTLLAFLAVVQARYLPTRADDANVRVVKHILSQLLHRSGRPSFLSQLRQPEAEESGELLTIPADTLYQ